MYKLHKLYSALLIFATPLPPPAPPPSLSLSLSLSLSPSFPHKQLSLSFQTAADYRIGGRPLTTTGNSCCWQALKSPPRSKFAWAQHYICWSAVVRAQCGSHTLGGTYNMGCPGPSQWDWARFPAWQKNVPQLTKQRMYLQELPWMGAGLL